jgi:hypothetical protein
MKKAISVYIIFVSLLMSFAGCGKLMNIVGLNQPEAFSEIDIKDLTKKESWKEWTCGQWKDNKWYWIGGTVVVAVMGYGVYRYSNPRVGRFLNLNDYQGDLGGEEDEDDGNGEQVEPPKQDIVAELNALSEQLGV